MKISVIMPVYNSEKYLQSAIFSVLMQEGADLEIIAIDDCSSDNSAQILASLAAADSRIRAYYNQTNIGVAAVRNKALSLATGDYLAFCDSDDTVPEGAYSALISAAQGEDFIIGAHADKSDSGQIRYASLGKEERSTSFRALFAVSCLWTKLIRRGFVIDNGILFQEDMRIGEDVVFLAEAAKRSPSFKVVDRVVYYHWHHIGDNTPSLIHTYTLDAFKLHIECRRRVLSICNDIPECRDFIYLYFSSFLTEALPCISPAPNRNEAFEIYKEYMLEYGFEGKERLFRSLVGVPYEFFVDSSAEEYFEASCAALPRERVLWDCEAGRMGLRWIIKYFRAWLGYKLGRR